MAKTTFLVPRQTEFCNFTVHFSVSTTYVGAGIFQCQSCHIIQCDQMPATAVLSLLRGGGGRGFLPRRSRVSTEGVAKRSRVGKESVS